MYKYCTNCTVCNWTVLTVITQKLLLHILLHKRSGIVQLSSEAQYGRLFDIVCVYRQSYPEIGSFKEIQITKNTLPKPHRATQPSLLNIRLISYQATARRRTWPTHPLGWDDAIQECGVIGHDVFCVQYNKQYHFLFETVHQQKAPFFAIYRRIHTATEPWNLQ